MIRFSPRENGTEVFSCDVKCMRYQCLTPHEEICNRCSIIGKVSRAVFAEFEMVRCGIRLGSTQLVSRESMFMKRDVLVRCFPWYLKRNNFSSKLVQSSKTEIIDPLCGIYD